MVGYKYRAGSLENKWKLVLNWKRAGAIIVTLCEFEQEEARIYKEEASAQATKQQERAATKFEKHEKILN